MLKTPQDLNMLATLLMGYGLVACNGSVPTSMIVQDAGTVFGDVVTLYQLYQSCEADQVGIKGLTLANALKVAQDPNCLAALKATNAAASTVLTF